MFLRFLLFIFLLAVMIYLVLIALKYWFGIDFSVIGAKIDKRHIDKEKEGYEEIGDIYDGKKKS